VLSLSGDMLLVAATSAACMLASVAFFVRYPRVPGAGLVRTTCGGAA
jgi:hypothetical protein